MSRREERHTELLHAIDALKNRALTKSEAAEAAAALAACKRHGLTDRGLPNVLAGVERLDRHILYLKDKVAALTAQAEAREAVIVALKARMITGGVE